MAKIIEKWQGRKIRIPSDLIFTIQMELKRSKFRISNNGSTVIKIEDIYTSCDCTSAWTDQDTIYPASQTDVYVKCKANDDDNDFIRYVYINLSNNETLSLPLCGFVTRRKDELRLPQY